MRDEEPGDPFDLRRFTTAQEVVYDDALAELRSGRKRTHWMWFIFPQLAGLAQSATARHYAIRSLDEARAYLGHAILGPRLLECAHAITSVEGRSATDILGSPDDLKLRSCATLFAALSPSASVFGRILDKYYLGLPDHTTIRRLEALERSNG